MKRKANRGFTLLEVVVAVAIVGLGVVTLLEIFSLGLRLATKSAAVTEATATGREVMDEILARRAVRQEAARELLSGRPGWSLRIEQREPEIELGSVARWRLEEIILELPYPMDARERRLQFRTVRLTQKKGS